MGMKSFLLVGLGGGIGSALRFAVSEGIKKLSAHPWPWGTLTVNLLGCLILGALTAWHGKTTDGIADHWRWLLMTGMMGGFTTFSTFGVETHALFAEGRSLAALANIAVSVIGGIAAVYIACSMTAR